MKSKTSCTFRSTYIEIERLTIIARTQNLSQADVIEMLINKFWYDSGLYKDKYFEKLIKQEIKEKYPGYNRLS